MELMQPVNQASVLSAGQALVPDYAAEEARKRLLDIQEMGAHSQAQQVQNQTLKHQREIQREAEFQQAMDQVLLNPNAANYSALMARFPEYSEGIKRGWDALDADVQKANLQGMSEVYAAAKNGRYDLATSLLQRRIEADKAGDGEADPTDEAILQGLQSTDETERKAALGMIGVGLAAITGPENFSATFGKLDDAGKRKTREMDGVVYDDDPDSPTYGDPLYASQREEIVNGLGGIYVRDPFRVGDAPGPGIISGYGGGTFDAQGRQVTPVNQGAAEPDNAPAIPVTNAKSIVEGMYPNARVTDWRRDPNSKLGKANPGSWHTKSGAAIDTAPVAGMSFGQYVKSFRDRGFAILEQRDEVKNPSRHATGPHWHVVIGYHKVGSVQQYNKLPKGAQFIDPKGNLRTKT